MVSVVYNDYLKFTEISNILLYHKKTHLTEPMVKPDIAVIGANNHGLHNEINSKLL